MNSVFIERMTSYRVEFGLDTMKKIIKQKIVFQFQFSGDRNNTHKFMLKIKKSSSMNELSLVEARAARIYWNCIGKKLEKKVNWQGRKARNGDHANKALDIGYHYLTNYIKKKMLDKNIPTGLGLLHRASKNKDVPLAYDLLEWLRPLLVDRIIVKFFKRKKNIFDDEVPAGYIINMIKDELEQKYYNRKLKYCVTLDYWISLYLNHFQSSVMNKHKFIFNFPSIRHETRCNKKSNHS